MSDARQLIGRWRLQDYTLVFREGDTAQPIGPRPFGVLIYTAAGYMPAHLRAEDATVSYMSYCGTYRVEDGVAYHTVDACDWEGVIGKVLKRDVEWQGERLVLVANGAPHEGRRGAGRLTWEREEAL